MNAPEAPLECRLCGRRHARDERFCADCGVPLGFAEGAADDGTAKLGDERHARARKVDPRYREGPLVTVAGARHLAEAELVQGMLLEEGIPSMLRRSRGFDVPDFLAAGPRDVLVPSAGAAAAREVLLQADLLGEAPAAGPSPARILAWLLAGTALIAAIALLLG